MAEEALDSCMDLFQPPQAAGDPNQPIETSPDGRFQRYNDKIGSGAQKTVWKGLQHSTGRLVAWCTISTTEMVQQQKCKIVNEMKLMKELEHPNLIKFISAWNNKQKQQFVFIAELLNGGSLKDYLKIIGQPRLSAIKQWCKQILDGLNYLHSQQPYPIIHRDIKTDNIFVCSTTGVLKIGDFGLSKYLEKQKNHTLVGTPRYIAPETFQEQYGTPIDIYAFGLVLLEICTGKTIYEECSSFAQIYYQKTSQLKPKLFYNILDEDVQDFIALCLAHSDERPSAGELLKHPFLKIVKGDENQVVNISEGPISPIISQGFTTKALGKCTFGELADDYADNPENEQLSVITEKAELIQTRETSGEENIISPIQIDIKDEINDLYEDDYENYGIEFSIALKSNFQAKRYLIRVVISQNYKNPYVIGEDIEKLIESKQPLSNQISNHLSLIVSNIINQYTNCTILHRQVASSSQETNDKSYELHSPNDISQLSCGKISPANQQDIIMERKGIYDKQQISKLHTALCNALHLKRIGENFYGIKTFQYVKKFQSQHGLYIDGKVDCKVWNLLTKYVTKNQQFIKMDKDRGIEPYPVTEEIYMVPCTINLSNNEYTPLCKPSGCQIQSQQFHARQAWLSAEDQFLKEYINAKGAKAWTTVARELNLAIHKGLPIRQGKQCRERWHNHLNPNLQKGNWSKNEDRYIFQMQQTIGNKWSEIAKGLPGRTENQVKNRFNSMIRKVSKKYPPNVDVASMLLAELGGYEMEYLSPQTITVISPLLTQTNGNQDMGFTIYAEYANSQIREMRNDFSPSLFLNPM